MSLFSKLLKSENNLRRAALCSAFVAAVALSGCQIRPLYGTSTTGDFGVQSSPVAADLAAIAAGGISVPLYDREEPKDLAVKLSSARPKVLMAGSAELAKGVEEAWDGASDCKIITFDTLFDHEPHEAAPREPGPKDTIAIIYTSGTSGEPKGVMLDRANIDFMLPKAAERIGRVV